MDWIGGQFAAMAGEFDERGRRRAATEALSRGWGGIAAVAGTTDLSDRTIPEGIQELEAGDSLSANRQR